MQTIIVSKAVAPTREAAKTLARKHARRIYTSRETKTSWRFRQRPPEDFDVRSFRTFKIPGEGVSLVYGDLKNPDLNYKRELKRFRELVELSPRAQDIQELAEIARRAHDELESNALRDQMDFQIAKDARRLGVGGMGDIYQISEHVRGYGQQALFEGNPSNVMPDPGACAWLGDLIEWKWENGDGDFLWENGKKKWMFLWSPQLKAVVGIARPKKMAKNPKVSRKGGAAKISERFKARDADSTHEIEIPKVKLLPLGKAVHIVYRSDKWNPGANVDYIHDFKDGVELHCGPDLKDPQVFLCRGGKLTVTERGLVF